MIKWLNNVKILKITIFWVEKKRKNESYKNVIFGYNFICHKSGWWTKKWLFTTCYWEKIISYEWMPVGAYAKGDF